MNLSIGIRVGIGFLAMILLLALCGGAGYYGVSRVASSLLFVSGPAWTAAEGGMAATINIQGEILTAERVLSSDIPVKEGRKLLKAFRKQSAESLEQIKASGLVDEELLTTTERLINQYRGAQLSLLGDFKGIREQREALAAATTALLDHLAAIETSVAKQIASEPPASSVLPTLKAMEKGAAEVLTGVLMRNYSMQLLFEGADPTEQMVQMNSQRKQMGTAFEHVSEAMTARGMKTELGSLKTAYDNVQQLYIQVVVDFTSFRESRDDMGRLTDRLLKSLVEVEARGSSAVTDEIDSVSGLVSQSKITIVAAAVAGLIAAMIALGVIIYTVVYPIRHIAANLQQIGAGEGDLNVSLPESGASELKTLATGFNHFVEKIRGTVSGVSTAVNELSGASNTLRHVSQEAAGAIDRQSAETEQVAAAINELSATAHDVAHNAASAASAATSADQAADRGKQEVDSTISAIQSQIAQLDSAATVIEQLARDSQSIGNVLNVINDIADKTNLLALNAAIEAARAGEAGRGFAVVADEVRELASRTQQATTEIQDVVNKLQNAASDAVSSMHNSRDFASQSAKQAEQAGMSLNDITRESNTISEMNLQIATAAEQQAAVAETVNQNVDSINERAQETRDASGRISHATQELTQVANRLQQLVSQFRF